MAESCRDFPSHDVAVTQQIEDAMQTDANRRTLAALLRLGDRLIEIFNRIDHGISVKSNPDVPVGLRELARLVRIELANGGFLTPERDAQLAKVEAELRVATTAEETGNRQEVWAALIRAHGRINSVSLDFMNNERAVALAGRTWSGDTV
jgi:hypothetical protein